MMNRRPRRAIQVSSNTVSGQCTSRRLYGQVNRSDLHSAFADFVSLALMVSYMGCVKTRAARIEIDAVSADQPLTNLLLNGVVDGRHRDADRLGVRIQFHVALTRPGMIKAILLRIHNQEQGRDVGVSQTSVPFLTQRVEMTYWAICRLYFNRAEIRPALTIRESHDEIIARSRSGI
jgi:hypothetical protein